MELAGEMVSLSDGMLKRVIASTLQGCHTDDSGTVSGGYNRLQEEDLKLFFFDEENSEFPALDYSVRMCKPLF